MLNNVKARMEAIYGPYETPGTSCISFFSAAEGLRTINSHRASESARGGRIKDGGAHGRFGQAAAGVSAGTRKTAYVLHPFTYLSLIWYVEMKRKKVSEEEEVHSDDLDS